MNKINQLSKATFDAALARQKALNCYKRLLRTRLVVFKGDDFAIKASHEAIRDSFEKNRHLQDPEDIMKQIEIAENAEEILRKEVMQARFITDNTVRVNVRLDNVRDNKTFSFANDD